MREEPEALLVVASLPSDDAGRLPLAPSVPPPLLAPLQNLRRHAAHYSFLRHLGPAAMTAVAERLGAGLYFNTLVPWRPHQVWGQAAGRQRASRAACAALSPCRWRDKAPCIAHSTNH